jgi:hypothetical protein
MRHILFAAQGPMFVSDLFSREKPLWIALDFGAQIPFFARLG